MTWTSAVGKSCGVVLYKIVDGLALARISPNFLTFIGLVINVVAALLFGFASADNNQPRLFFLAGLVIIGAGIFDMVDGRVARATNQVTDFGGFFDSVIDRYSDVALFFGLLVYYARGNRFFYVVLVAFVMVSSVHHGPRLATRDLVACLHRKRHHLARHGGPSGDRHRPGHRPHGPARQSLLFA